MTGDTKKDDLHEMAERHAKILKNFEDGTSTPKILKPGEGATVLKEYREQRKLSEASTSSTNTPITKPFMKIDRVEFEKDYALSSKDLLAKYDIETTEGLNRVLLISDIKTKIAIIEGRIPVNAETLEKVKIQYQQFKEYLSSPDSQP